MLKPDPPTVDDALRVVKEPDAGVVEPIDGGDAKRDVNPAPLTVDVAERVVNAPLLGAVFPMADGDENRAVKPAPLTVDEADRVVNAPDDGATLPIADGDENKEVKPAPLTVDEADRVVNAPVLGVVLPIGPGAANVVPFSVAALTVELHPNPDPTVQFKALVDVLQDGIVRAVGTPTVPVELPITLLAAMVARDTVYDPEAALTAMPDPAITDETIDDQPGAVDGPVETIACPADDPAGLSSWIGFRVVALAAEDAITAQAAQILLSDFIPLSLEPSCSFRTFRLMLSEFHCKAVYWQTLRLCIQHQLLTF